MTSFLAAVAARQPDEAAGLCTPELKETLRRDGGIAANFATLRALLNSRKDISHDTPSFNFSGSACDATGWVVYLGTESAPYSIKLVELEGSWRIRGYEFDAIPPPLAAVPSASSLNHRGVPPGPGGVCPAGYPIKGSRTAVYHVPGGRYYATTSPVMCFPTAEDAKAADFWPSKRG